MKSFKYIFLLKRSQLYPLNQLPNDVDSSVFQHTFRLPPRCEAGNEECYLHYKVPVEQNKTQAEL